MFRSPAKKKGMVINEWYATERGLGIFIEDDWSNTPPL